MKFTEETLKRISRPCREKNRQFSAIEAQLVVTAINRLLAFLHGRCLTTDVIMKKKCVEKGSQMDEVRVRKSYSVLPNVSHVFETLKCPPTQLVFSSGKVRVFKSLA